MSPCVRKSDFFLPREVEFALRHFGIHSDDLELMLLERCKPIQATGCWEWQGVVNATTGYGSFFFLQSEVHSGYAHRISYELWNGPITRAKPYVLHRCDNRPCVNPEHLFAGTQKENVADMIAKGRAKFGARALCDDEVSRISSEVAALRAQGLSQAEIARQFGKAQSWVSNVVHGKAFTSQRMGRSV